MDTVTAASGMLGAPPSARGKHEAKMTTEERNAAPGSHPDVARKHQQQIKETQWGDRHGTLGSRVG